MREAVERARTDRVFVQRLALLVQKAQILTQRALQLLTLREREVEERARTERDTERTSEEVP